ncbi:MAG: nitronate monooxygenase, partial [Spirochaetia bacterium]|nr:nitronate monooxygenase [Spirochaetia bacterium]
DMLGIDLPIIGAPMFLVSYPDLVVAVSEAGGIGCFPSLNYRSPEQLKDGIQEIRSRTKKPIGVNLILHKGHNPNWQAQYDVLMQLKIELVITSLGTPRTIAKEIKASGAHLFCDVTTLKHAEIVAKSGADALIAVAAGAGGHAGAITPFSLFPYLKKETGLPVVASGAISTGKQMVASFALGAEAVYLGTRLIATPEAQAQDAYKTMLVESSPEDIVYTEKISGIPANWLKQSVDKAAHLLAGGEHGSLDEYKRWKDIWSAGQGVAQIHEITPAREIVHSMVREYEDIMKLMPRAVL